MVGDSSFTLLREIGSMALGENEEIRFSIDAYRGFRYVSVRRYIQTDGFSGPTRDGLALTPEIVHLLEPKIAALSDQPSQIADVQLGRFAKRPGICIVAAVGMIKGQRGLLLRQWQDNVGWTKKGIWLPLDKIRDIKTLFRKTREILNEEPEDDF
ncbi:MAG: hypothetical protein IKP06_03865 [Elusimicrobiaceae bacterium]|nr:hypothetical protein [Elusimicrobiaceae bacterium]